jgi:two-component system response regulator NreC
VAVHLRLAQAPVGSTSGAEAERAIRVVLADDHEQMRRGLRRVLDGEAGVSVIAEADDLTNVMRHVRGQRPNVLVFDLRMRMAHGSGSEAIRALRAEAPGTEIVVVSMEESPAFARQALQAGAIGFVLKDTADAELPEAVRRAARSERYVSPRVDARLAQDRRAARAARSGRALRRGLPGN